MSSKQTTKAMVILFLNLVQLLQIQLLQDAITMKAPQLHIRKERAKYKKINYTWTCCNKFKEKDQPTSLSNQLTLSNFRSPLILKSSNSQWISRLWKKK
jgi:hypothetical protein